MFDLIDKFEQQLSSFYGAKFAVATDCCTHAIELCLRLEKSDNVSCPSQTYVSVPMTFIKLNLQWNFNGQKWEQYYYIGNTRIIDAAVYWKENGYIQNSLMCLSFQYKKHLSLGRGGAILTNNKDEYQILKKMSYDGRQFNIPWREQNISTVGYHYYMTPETALLGLDKLDEAKRSNAQKITYSDYPYLPNMKVFNV